MFTQQDSEMLFRVYIPSELSVIKRPKPLPPLDFLIPQEDRICICANTFIPKETRFHPLSGRVENKYLPILQFISPHDIRAYFGASDHAGLNAVRETNWVRFVTFSDTLTPDVNVIARKLSPMGDAIFEAVTDIAPHAKIVVYGYTFSHIIHLCNSFYQPESRPVSPEVPLDLSSSTNPTLKRRRDSVSPDSSLYSSEEEEPYSSGSPETSRAYKQPRLESQEYHAGYPVYNYHANIFPSLPSSSDDSLSPPTTPPHLRRIKSPKLAQKRKKEKTLLQCSYCPKKFDRPSLLDRHQRTHTGEKPHQCDLCDKAFSTSSSLNTHRRIHSGEKPHRCPVCGKCFTASSNLYYHRLTHVHVKPHKCTYCPRSFPTPGDLRTHTYTHTKDYPYVCAICNKGFGKATNLKSHQKSHQRRSAKA